MKMVLAPARKAWGRMLMLLLSLVVLQAFSGCAVMPDYPCFPIETAWCF